MVFGITPQGFVLPQLSDIQEEINQTLIAQFGANINLGAESVFGQISGIFAEREALIWQAMQDVYNSQGPSTAFGASLDNVGDLRGIPRLSAKASVVQNVKLFGTAGTPVPVGTQYNVVDSPTSLFAQQSSVTLVAGQDCIQHIAFSGVPATGNWALTQGNGSTGTLAFNASAATIQTAIRANFPFAAGTTVTGNYTIGFNINFLGAGTGGKMVQDLIVVSSNTLATVAPAPVTVTPAITQAGIDQADITAIAVSTGPVIANTGTLTMIATPISGLTNVLNTQDAAIGRNVETDNEYRARMAEELQIAGAGTVEAIRSRLLNVTGVTAVIVFENVTDTTDGNSLPPHSFEAFVQGGADQDIANTIWAAKPAGINTYGTSNAPVIDSQGLSHTIYFSRPTQLSIYIIINIHISATYPSNGDALVKQALVDFGNSLGIGQEVIVVPKLISSIASIPGIETAAILIGTAPGPTLGNNIPVGIQQIAVFDTGRVTVNHV